MENQVIWYDMGGAGNDFYNVLAYQLNYQKIFSTNYSTQAIRNIIAEQVKKHWHYYKYLTSNYKKGDIYPDRVLHVYIIGIRMGTIFNKKIESQAVADALNLNLLIIKNRAQTQENVIEETYYPYLPGTDYRRKTVCIGYDKENQKYNLLLRSGVTPELISSGCVNINLKSGLSKLCTNINKVIHNIKVYFNPGIAFNQTERLASEYSELFDKTGHLGRAFFRTLLKKNCSSRQQIVQLLKYIKQLVLEQKISFKLAEDIYNLTETRIFRGKTDLNILKQLQNNLKKAICHANQLKPTGQETMMIQEKDLRLFNLIYWCKIRALIPPRGATYKIDKIEAQRKLLHFVFKYEALSQRETLSLEKPFTCEYIERQLNKIKQFTI